MCVYTLCRLLFVSVCAAGLRLLFVVLKFISKQFPAVYVGQYDDGNNYGQR